MSSSNPSAAIVVAALALSACAERASTLPTLTDIRSTATAPATSLDQQAADAHVLTTIQHIDLPLDVATDDLWSRVDETAVSPLTQITWNANGLRLGLISRDDLPALASISPKALNIELTQLLSTGQFTPLRRALRQTEPITVDLTTPPQPTQLIHVRGGQLQLLASMTAAPDGSAEIDLLPHHYVPRLSVIPRDPLEKQLDGRSFDPLAVHLKLNPQQVLVVGLYRPWPKSHPTPATEPTPATTAPQSTTASPSHDHVGPAAPSLDSPQAPQATTSPDASAPPADAATTRDVPRLLPHLGRALLTARRLNQPMQVLLLITVEPLPPATAPDRAAPAQDAMPLAD
jgi:hypothetical protein